MMLRNLALAASVLALASCMTASDTSSPANAGFDARIIRDSFGVPHIYGKRNADVAYGLAYAHAEDDWKNIEEVIRASRGTLAEIVGDSGAKSDDFILALGNTDLRECFSVLMMDLDRFKEVNDTLGHLRGDDLLRTVASSLNSVSRPNDNVCRYAGDEFVMILPGVRPERGGSAAGPCRRPARGTARRRG